MIVFLAHIGSFVPADSAIVGLTDRLVYKHFPCISNGLCARKDNVLVLGCRPKTICNVHGAHGFGLWTKHNMVYINTRPAISLTFSRMFYRIFCAMGSKSMTTEQSTFMIDLHQVATMLRYH